MALSLKDIRTTAIWQPPRLLIYGPPGIGKTLLASEFPKPVFLDLEGGLAPGMPVANFGQKDLPTYSAVVEALSSLYYDEHDYKTVVIDSIDRLEPLLWQHVCAENNWASIEAPGWGKGYVEADRTWLSLVSMLNALRRDRGMMTIAIAHSEVKTFDDPRSVPYSRYDIRVHKRALAIWQDDVDAILFINQDPTVKIDQEKVGKGKAKAHVEGGGTRWINTEMRPAWTSKNRYGIPDRLLYKPGDGFKQLEPYFAKGYVAPVQAVDPEPVAEQTEEVDA